MKHQKPKSALRDDLESIALLKGRLRFAPSYQFRREYYDLIGEFGHLIRYLFNASELQHRYRFDDPRPALVEAIQLSETLADRWKEGNELKDSECPNGKLYTSSGRKWEELPKCLDVIYFRFATAAIISLLHYKEMSKKILAVVPDLSKVDYEQIVCPLNYPDAELVKVIQSSKRPRSWKRMIEFIEGSHGNAILPDTMECYADIVVFSNAKKWDRALDAVKRAHELYDLRGKAWYDEFETWEGNGAGNALSMDLRLSALMRYCFRGREKLIDQLESIHQWKY